MAEILAILRNTGAAVREETVEGTLIAEQAADAILLGAEGVEFNLGRELLESSFMTGSLSKSAPVAGMWSDDVGWTIPTFARGAGILASGLPDYHVPLKSLMGQEESNTDNTVNVSPAPTAIAFTTGSSNDMVVGQLIRVNSEITRITSVATDALTVWPPLSAIPSGTDVITAGKNFMLASSGWPSFSSYIYFDGPKRLALAGGRTTTLNMNFTVGQRCPLTFSVRSLQPYYDVTSRAVTPTLDTTTAPPVCLGMTLSTTFVAVATGTPTTTETILLAPNFHVAVDDEILLETSAGVWETETISAISGDPPGNLTLTHSAVSGSAVSATDTLYIRRKKCAGIGDTLEVTIEMEVTPQLCMQASAGKMAAVPTSRTVTLSKTPYFSSWQE
ncbi:MAG: hypothetical protein GY796_08190, partial [Chloroflexi bacterium]|nr:hypothetical protein [Chloroflexota bacterium]